MPISEITEIEFKLETLEVKLAYQEVTIEQLNHIVIAQQKKMDILQEQIKYLSQKLKGFEPGLVGDISDEPPPPHY